MRKIFLFSILFILLTSSYAQETSVPTKVVIPEENPPASPSNQPSGGGGGNGGRTELVRDFTVNPDLIKITLKQGNLVTKTIEIKNTGNTNLNIIITPLNLDGFLLIEEKEFLLKRRESKIITLDLFSSIEQPPGINFGKLVIQSGDIIKEIPLIIEIKGRDAIFDIQVKVKDKNKFKGEDVEADITLLNSGDLKPVDVTLYYALMGLEGKEIIFTTETLALEDELKITRRFTIPANIEAGNYLFYAKLEYLNQTAFGSDTFTVISEQQPKTSSYQTKYLWFLLLLISRFEYKKKKKKKAKILNKAKITKTKKIHPRR